MITAVSIFSCTNDYDPGLIENLGMKEQPLRIITKVLTTKSPNFMQEFTRGKMVAEDIRIDPSRSRAEMVGVNPRGADARSLFWVPETGAISPIGNKPKD